MSQGCSMQAELSSVLATKPAEAGHKPRIPASCNGDRRPVAESSVGCYRARIPAAVETVRRQPKNHAGTAMNLLGGSLLACPLAPSIVAGDPLHATPRPTLRGSRTFPEPLAALAGPFRSRTPEDSACQYFLEPTITISHQRWRHRYRSSSAILGQIPLYNSPRARVTAMGQSKRSC
jgi:hypothetical protein